ncbi:secretion protein HlyD [Ketogulonicigenium robustum]|uniref:Secretion protein HlyD n=1 Tax=Ketogulonicigenium robustum TaxID=92947 RepID=A0A1W6NX25_9RHOB|nr:efflux RND transporter periplasmic adaptor subunit [Ketogulonicigenium robustum]ARO13703.1 secretion protein HlyD [Ketogulonicigenium robustum]
MNTAYLPASALIFTVICASLPPAPLAAMDEAILRSVYSVSAQTRPLPALISMTGTIGATNAVTAAFGTGGRIIQIDVGIGDVVAAGQVLAKLDPTQQTEQLRIAEASLAAANATLETVTASYQRQQALLENGNTTRAAYEEAYQSLVSATSARDNASAQLAKAQQALNDTTLLASEDAIVTARDAEVGQVVAAAQNVLELANVSGREAIFYAPDVIDLTGLQGLGVMITPIGVPDSRYQAEITEISPYVDAQVGSIRVKARLVNPAGQQLPIGDAVIGTIDAGALNIYPHQGIVVPWSSLSADVNGPAVWTIDPADNRVTLQPVEIISYTSDQVLLQPTLPATSRIVTEGIQFLYAGQQVDDLGDAP